MTLPFGVSTLRSVHNHAAFAKRRRMYDHKRVGELPTLLSSWGDSIEARCGLHRRQQPLPHLVELLGHARLDFGKLVEKLAIGYELPNLLLQRPAEPASRSRGLSRAQQRFLSSLRALPFFELRLGVLKPRGNTWVEKGIDVKVAVDMIGMAYKNQYDVALLVSGDGDYVDCVRAVKDAGRHVVNAYFVSSQSLALRDACDNWICMDKDYLVDVLK